MKTFILIGILCGIFSETSQLYKNSKKLDYKDFSMMFAIISAITTFMELLMFISILFLDRPWLNHDAVLMYCFLAGFSLLIKDLTKNLEYKRKMSIIHGILVVGCQLGLLLNILKY